MKNNKGITLIALVVTIIVLIILASVSINIVFGENGIIRVAEKARKDTIASKILEDLNLYEGELSLNNSAKISIRQYLDYIKNKDYKVVEEENKDNTDKSKYIIVDEEYVYLVEDIRKDPVDDENDDGALIKITYEGKVEDLFALALSRREGEYIYPLAGEVRITKNATKGEIEVISLNPEIATVEKISEEKFRVIPGTTAGEAEIKVIAKANGKYERKEITYTAIVRNGTLNVTAIGYSGDYDEQEHRIVVNCEQEGAEIKYLQQDGTYGILNPGYTMPGEYSISYEVTLNGYTPVSGTENVVINRLSDIQPPVKAVVLITGNTNTTTLPATLSATVTHKDTDAPGGYESSDIDINNCKYILNDSNVELGTDASSYTNTFNSNNETLTLVLNNTGNHYLHILTVDNSENKIETIKGPISVTANYHQHTGSKSTGTGCYTIERTGSNLTCGKSEGSTLTCGKTEHSHGPGCRSTTTCTKTTKVKPASSDGSSSHTCGGTKITRKVTKTITHSACGTATSTSSSTAWKCSSCGGQASAYGWFWGRSVADTTSTHTVEKLTCTKTEHTHTSSCYTTHTHTDSCYTPYTYYDLGCEKTESTIVSYSINY